MFRKTLLIFFLILICFISLTSYLHPIFLKWIVGEARIGYPVKAKIYTNGVLNKRIKIFRVKSSHDYYVVHFLDGDTKNGSAIAAILVHDTTVGRPSATHRKEYDFFFNLMFQGEVGRKFSSYRHDMKGYDFDPELRIFDNKITYKIPSLAEEFNCDSIRIEF